MMHPPRQAGFKLAWVVAIRLGMLAIVLPLFGSLALAQTPTAEVRTLDGTKVAGTMVEVTIDQLKLETAKGPQVIALSRIEAIQFPESRKTQLPEQAAQFQLLDGSSVFVKQYKLADQKIASTLTGGTAVSIPKRNVSSIVFKSDDNAIQRQVDQIKQDADIVADTLVVLRGEEFNAIEGIVKGLDQKSVQFAIEDQSADVPIEKLSAITFFKAGQNDYSDPLATCVLSDTSRIKLRGFNLAPKQLVLTSLTGEKFNVDFTDVVSLEFDATVFIPITDLMPSTNDWNPLLAGSGIVEKLRSLRLARMNQSFSGRPLSLEVPRTDAEIEAGKTLTVERSFETGIAIQGGGRLAWRLDGDYQSIKGLVGFSPDASEFGNVKLRLLVDGKVAYEQELVKSAMTEPETFEVDLQDRQRMIIEIDYADGRSIGDMIHLVNVTLQK